MRDVIDELSLKIDIDVEKGIDKTISSLARAITKLNSAVSNVGALQNYVKTLGKMTAKATSVPQSTAIGKTITPEYIDIPNTSSKSNKTLETIKENSKKANVEIKTLISGLKNLKTNKKPAKDVKGLADALAKAGNETGKFSEKFKGLVRSIGRIAFYRLIRSAVSLVTKSFEEGLKSYVQYDEATNKSMSNIINSFNQVKATMGVTIGYLVQAFEPLITTISDGFMKMLNGLNMFLAKLQGERTFKKAIKQNKDYSDSVKEITNQLLSFDKFEALTQPDNKNSLFEFKEVAIDEETDEVVLSWADGFQKVYDIANGLIQFLKDNLPLIASLIAGIAIGKLVFNVASLVSKFKQLDPAQKSLTNMKIGISALVVSVSFLVDGINDFINLLKNGGSTIEWVSTVLQVLAGLLGTVFAILMFTKATKAKTIVGAIAGVLAVGAVITSAIASSQKAGQDIKKMKYGGTFEKGTQFIAGEAGAEAVYNTKGGSGGVVNIEQFTNAMYNALSLYGVARGSDISFGGSVYMDGKKVGQLVEKSVYTEGIRVGDFRKN